MRCVLIERANLQTSIGCQTSGVGCVCTAWTAIYNSLLESKYSWYVLCYLSKYASFFFFRFWHLLALHGHANFQFTYTNVIDITQARDNQFNDHYGARQQLAQVNNGSWACYESSTRVGMKPPIRIFSARFFSTSGRFRPYHYFQVLQLHRNTLCPSTRGYAETHSVAQSQLRDNVLKWVRGHTTSCFNPSTF